MGRGYDEATVDHELGKAFRAERGRRGLNKWKTADLLGEAVFTIYEIEHQGLFRTRKRLEAARAFVNAAPAARLRPGRGLGAVGLGEVRHDDVVGLLANAVTRNDVLSILSLADRGGLTIASILKGAE